MGIIKLNFTSFSKWKVLEWARQACFDWHEAPSCSKPTAGLHASVVCLPAVWRGLILHSRVDRSLACFIHSTCSWCVPLVTRRFPELQSASHTPNNESVLLATDLLWGDCIGPLLLYTFWVKISLALLFWGQGTLVYRWYCQRVLPHLSPCLYASLSVCVLLILSTVQLSSCVQYMCVYLVW